MPSKSNDEVRSGTVEPVEAVNVESPTAVTIRVPRVVP
jgi:hypothetical protein